MLRKITNQRFSLMPLQEKRQVGAGKVVPFLVNKKTQIIAVPSQYETRSVYPFEVCGDSFIEEDIRDGDTLVTIFRFEKSEVTDGRLCVVRVAESEEILKRVYFINKYQIRLACANRNYSDLVYGVEQVEILALVVGKWQALK